jgi:hypothetical protein
MLFGTTLATAGVIAVSSFALAQGFTTKDTGVTEAANKAGYQTNLACANAPGGCIPAYAGTIVNALSGLFGAYFFVLILYGGFLYMTAGGEAAKTTKARQTIVNAIIGMLIVASSYAIASYVLNAMAGATTGTTVG